MAEGRKSHLSQGGHGNGIQEHEQFSTLSKLQHGVQLAVLLACVQWDCYFLLRRRKPRANPRLQARTD